MILIWCFGNFLPDLLFLIQKETSIYQVACWLMLVCSAAGVYVVANGKKALNMVSFNFLGVAGNPTIKVSSFLFAQIYIKSLPYLAADWLR